MNTRLKTLRLARTLSQGDMARILKIDQASYSRYEAGRALPDVGTRARIAAILGVPVKDVFDLPQEMHQ